MSLGFTVNASGHVERHSHAKYYRRDREEHTKSVREIGEKGFRGWIEVIASKGPSAFSLKRERFKGYDGPDWEDRGDFQFTANGKTTRVFLMDTSIVAALEDLAGPMPDSADERRDVDLRTYASDSQLTEEYHQAFEALLNDPTAWVEFDAPSGDDATSSSTANSRCRYRLHASGLITRVRWVPRDEKEGGGVHLEEEEHRRIGPEGYRQWVQQVAQMSPSEWSPMDRKDVWLMDSGSRPHYRRAFMLVAENRGWEMYLIGGYTCPSVDEIPTVK